MGEGNNNTNDVISEQQQDIISTFEEDLQKGVKKCTDAWLYAIKT